jgi:GT2 family glycosyltransferase
MGDILVLLNDDTQVLTQDWLAELVSLAVQPDVGCVGPLLLYPDRTVQHAGITVGLYGLAGHAFAHADPKAAGHDARLHVRREVSAVTGACLAVRKSLYERIGGMREDLAVDLNDIDFCLRLRERGYRNLYTPHARLLHFESASRGRPVSGGAIERHAVERARFLGSWGLGILDDPFYSPNLSRQSTTYRLRYEQGN